MHKKSRVGLVASLSLVVALAFPALPAAASSAETVQAGFNWHANAAPDPSAAKARAALKKYRIIDAKGSWICSPAGFGQRSRCTRG